MRTLLFEIISGFRTFHYHLDDEMLKDYSVSHKNFLPQYVKSTASSQYVEILKREKQNNSMSLNQHIQENP